MDMRQLRYFISVAEHLSFTEASKHLFVAQSAVSQQIAELEKKIGVRLFERNKRSVKLTNAGSVLLEEAILLIKKSEETVNKVRQAELGIIGNLQIGFLGYTERSFLPDMVREFRADYPSVQLGLDQYNHGALIDKLSTGDLDIIFTLSFGLENLVGFESMGILDENISVVMHKDHPYANASDFELSELSQEDFIVLSREESPQGFNQTLMICGKNGFSPHIVSQPKLISTVLLLVDSGMGIAILPSSLKYSSSSSLRFKEIKGETNKLVAAWKKSNENPSIALFLEKLGKLE